MAEPTEIEISVPSPGKSAIPVLLTSPPKDVKHSGFALLLGPGAGGDEKTALLTAVANEVARQGHFCARYRAKVPNLGFRVSVCTRVMEHLFHPTKGIHPQKGCFLGGHSMGTRVAGTVAAQLASSSTGSEPPAVEIKAPATKGKKAAAAAAKKAAASTTASVDSDFPADFVPGLVLFSYPLHTADNTKALRDQILLDIPPTTATLFISGLKDNMCQPSIFAKVFKEMNSTPREVVQVTDADHGLGFGSSKPAQAKKEALAEAISEWTVAFLDEAIAHIGDVSSKKKTVAKKAGASAGEVTKKKAELKKEADEWTVAFSTVA
ncbi:hypothetical protein BGZ96_009119 [Linnemannia gamsii]|uniref:KANL3/Tex30 alpha/beta hydrolase-like domain-containing protein n=1 Tax=Linnemannia gamsii TaxID=64522 RepID=A0ABQ7JYZ8_9FUNG|nr:hypothetical protein BGZ96_009119 [Linnemannia gamsii]